MNMRLAFLVMVAALASVPAWAIGDKGLAEVVAKKAGVDAATAAKVLDAFKSAVVEQVKAGEDVRLRGFGKFYGKHMKARKGRNPKTGKEMQIPARTYLRFKPSRKATEALNAQ